MLDTMTLVTAVAWAVALSIVAGALVLIVAVVSSAQERRQWERNPARRVLEELGRAVDGAALRRRAR